MRNQERLGRDFGWLWAAYTVSAAGSALSTGVLPFVAIVVLDAAAWQVSLLAVLSGLAAAALALPLGGIIERRRKRPVMVAADVVRFATTLSVPLAMSTGRLTFGLLCLVAIVNATATIGFAAAGAAHLKGLIPPPSRTRAHGRLDSTYWLATSAGAPAGGALLGLLGPAVTLLVDAFSFLISATLLRSVHRPETPAVGAPTGTSETSDLTAGWRCIFRSAGLTALFWNAMLFGGALMMVAPLTAVLMLRDLHFQPWQYGLVLGLPCLGGALGAVLAGTLTRRYGGRAVLLGSGVLRTPWLLLVPLAPAGTSGVAVLLAAQTGLLFAAGVFNPSFATYRMGAAADSHMARVSTAWSVSSKIAQPAFIGAGACLAAVTSIPSAILVGAILCAASSLLLPWHEASGPYDPEVAPRVDGHRRAEARCDESRSLVPSFSLRH